MSGLSLYEQTQILNLITMGAYVSLHTADPGGTGASEFSGDTYARQGPVPFAYSGANPTNAQNSAIVTYPAALTAWSPIGFFGVWDALTGGNFRGSGPLDVPKTVNPGDQLRFLTNSLTIAAGVGAS